MVSNKEMHSVFQRFATREVDVWVQHRLSELPNLTEGRNLCPSVWMLSAYLKNHLIYFTLGRCVAEDPGKHSDRFKSNLDT